MPRRSQLEGDSLKEVVDEARRRFGPEVKIVSVDRVITGGIGGFFGKERYEAVVEEPDRVRTLRAADPISFDGPARIGIADLLDDADSDDVFVPKSRTAREAVTVSTTRPDFNELLDELVADTTPRPLPDASPRLAGLGGDLVALVGLGNDAVAVARAMAKSHGTLLGCAGSADAEGISRVDGRRGAIQARAEGVRAELVTVVAVGSGVDDPALEQILADLSPEQVWAVVDASRKPEDTALWVAQVTSLASIHALAVVGTELTRTPRTPDQLGLPVGWTAAPDMHSSSA